MRWDALRAGSPDEGSSPAQPAPMLFEQRAVTRTFDTPAFRGMTFFEVQARSIINRVPDASRVPFRWTINPYRGCSHSCVVLLCPEVAHLSGPGLGPRLRLQDRGQGQRAGPGAQGAGRAAVARRAHRHGHERGLLPARGGALPAHARHPRRAAGRGQPVLDPHQGHADPAGPRSDRRGGRGDRRRARGVGGMRGHRAVAGAGAGDAEPAAAAGGVCRVHRRRPALRGADGPGRAVPVRFPGAAREHRAADRAGRGGLGHADRAAPAHRGAGVVLPLAGRGAPRAWCPATAPSTAAAPTPRRPTRSR